MASVTTTPRPQSRMRAIAGRLRRLTARVGRAVRAAHSASVPF